MASETAKSLSSIARIPFALTGPILEKELRVSSRRARSFVLRCVYVALLTAFVVIVWSSMVLAGGATWGRAAGSDAASIVVTTILQFQFYAAQLIALVMLSSAISDEIYARTLGILMTTPISSLQIVLGKLFSKLLQVLLLLAISVPLLALVRGLGGISLGFVVGAVCITVSAAVFAGAVSLSFSIGNRRAYAAILKGFFVLVTLYVLAPLAIFLGLERDVPPWLVAAFPYVNPPAAMIATQIHHSAAGAGLFAFHWPLHCLIMLALAAAVLAVCVARVRRAALRQICGLTDSAPRAGKRPRAVSVAAPAKPRLSRIRRVGGWPVVWREVRRPMFRSFGQGLVAVLIVAGGLLATYYASADFLDHEVAHMVYVLMLGGIASLGTAVLAATAITSEKEAQTLPILLTTPLSGWQIIAGKAAGVFRRCLPVWALLAGHVVLFTMGGFIHPVAIPHLALIALWMVLFLTGSGLYFSARFRRSTGAVLANIGLALSLWVAVPVLLGLLSALSPSGCPTLTAAYVSGNPLVQTVVVMNAAGGQPNAARSVSALDYQWPDDQLADFQAPRMSGIALTTIRIALSLAIYGACALIFAARAKARLRRPLF